MKPPADVLLVFPPFWDPMLPYLSVPTLAAYLRRAGFGVDTVDLNREVHERIARPEWIESSLETARAKLAGTGAIAAESREEFARNLEQCEEVWRLSGPALVAAMPPSGEPVTNVEEWTAFQRRQYWMYRLLSAPFFPAEISPAGLVTAELFDTLTGLCDLVENSDGIPAAALVLESAEKLARNPPAVLGLSIAGPSQLHWALLFARTFKQRAPGTFIVLGGAHLPYLKQSLLANPRPLAWIDAAVSGEGELPLLGLVECIVRGQDPAATPGLLLARGGSLVSTGAAPAIDVNTLPPPDFSGFEPHRYPGNQGTVPLTFARGCSWSRCAFCTQYICFEGYRAMDPEVVRAHVVAVQEQVHASTFTINDENLTPRRLLEFSRIVRESAAGVSWQALARCAPSLADREIARELAAGGCRMLSFGLESASQDVLDFINKGIQADRVPDVFRTIQEAGIWVHSFLIFALPGETAESAARGIDFLVQHRDGFDSISPTIFRLEQGSRIALNPERYGLALEPVPADHCDIELPIADTAWLTAEEGMIFLDLLVRAFVGARQCPIEQRDLNGQIILDLLHRLGTDGLRAEMARRARETAAASAALSDDNEGFGAWWDAFAGPQLAAQPRDRESLLAEPGRGMFVPLPRVDRAFLDMRSLGIPLDSMLTQFTALCGDEDGALTALWSFKTAALALLATRVIQETGDYRAAGKARLEDSVAV